MVKIDYLVIGSGIAGLFSALKLSDYNPDKEIVVITKNAPQSSNSYYAQGGISIVSEPEMDLVNLHIADTIKVGDQLCSIETVSRVCENARFILSDLEALGIAFDRNENGEYDLNKEAGHSRPRILHHKDLSGKYVIDKLLTSIKSRANIKLKSNVKCIDLIVKGKECHGALAYSTEIQEKIEIQASATILATGGIGQLFRFSTNPATSTGDGISMAHRIGAKMKDLEFIQFHPTSIFQQDISESRVPIISEAVRGKGAVLKNIKGDAFMSNYHVDADLAPRDIVSRAIVLEMKKHSSNHVYLDCRSIDSNKFKESFPQIMQSCTELGLDPTLEMIPVVPAAHFSCGGVKVDTMGETSIRRLFASGECAYTGMHGANRLASNSLLEALVFANICAQSISNKYHNRVSLSISSGKMIFSSANSSDMKRLNTELKELMSRYFYIECSTVGLKMAKQKLKELTAIINGMIGSKVISIEALDLQNRIIISKLIIEAALRRKENRGCFYNTSLEVV